MVYKVKNKTYQSLTLVIDGKSITIPARKALENVVTITKQMTTLKHVGMLQIIKK